mgnify:FL=1|tara:strand:- start:37615 stop:39198 length:1584 start_codon:yes stop_codon:yes gene_type:complete
MAGKPLIYYSITACLKTPGIDEVVVTTDDEEIALFARRFGADVVIRPDSLGDDSVTLDPVIRHALEASEVQFARRFDYVVTVQPTSPLITTKELSGALRMLKSREFDTVLSVVDDRHLCWTIVDGKQVPEYTDRINRQFLPPRYRETGAIIACNRQLLIETDSRIGTNVGLLEVEQDKSFDIDTVSDFMLCENLLRRKRVVFRVIGNQSVGMGHAYRALMVANELVGHNLLFLCTEDHKLAADFIASKNFVSRVCLQDSVLDEIDDFDADLVINDILDTDAAYMQALRDRNIASVNFEDLGPGMNLADLVINALYPPSSPMHNVKSGPDYFCLRDEFEHRGPEPTMPDPGEVLLCFGGVDEGNLSLRVLEAIFEHCETLDMHVTIVIGSGYMHRTSLDAALVRLGTARIALVTATAAISEYMTRACFAITSGGRTVFELASLKTPCIVICQNDRETTHHFGPDESGVLNLGHRDLVADKDISKAFLHLATNPETLQAMRNSLSQRDFSSGKSRVISLLRDILEGTDE